MTPERSYAGYTLHDLEEICMAKASAPMNGDELVRYRNAAMATLPFLVARIHQLERHREHRSRGQGRRQGAAR